jgi:bifunctional non-homologous end joining protein LigD
MALNTEIAVGNKRLKLSNLDKVLFPKSGFTKGQVIDYYARVAPTVLPHLKDRALTLKRYPEGVGREFFYEKRCPSFRPSWFKTASVWSRRNQETIRYCLVNDLPSLVWIANIADLELHTSLARHQKPGQPTVMVFDLDPGPPADIINCAQVALWLREMLEKKGLQAFPKTTGSKGLQVYVPLNTPVSFDLTKAAARRVAEIMADQHPDQVLFRMEKIKRKGKVFVDWSQNDRHKTTVCVYSLRAKDSPTVSTPVKWKEIEDALRTGKAAHLSFQSDEALARVKKFGDLFEPVLELKQKLPKWE